MHLTKLCICEWTLARWPVFRVRSQEYIEMQLGESQNAAAPGENSPQVEIMNEHHATDLASSATRAIHVVRGDDPCSFPATRTAA